MSIFSMNTFKYRNNAKTPKKSVKQGSQRQVN